MSQFAQWLRRFVRADRPRTRRPRRAVLAPETLEDRTMPSVAFTPQYGAEQAKDDGGQKLNDVSLYLIFWGSAWNNPTPGNPTIGQVAVGVEDMLAGHYLKGLAQYGTDGNAFLAGLTLVPGDVPSGQFGDSEIRTVIENAQNSGAIPKSNTLALKPIYCVFTPPGVASNIPHAVGDNTDDHDPQIWVSGLHPGGLPAGGSVLDRYTSIFSHELAEAVTCIDGDGIVVTHGALWDALKKNPGDNQIGDAEAQDFTYRIYGTLVQAVWAQNDPANPLTDNTYLVPDGNRQTFVVTNGNLIVNGDQIVGNPNDQIVVDENTAGGVMVTMNAETVSFDPGQIEDITINTGGGTDSVDVEASNVTALKINLGNGLDTVSLGGIDHDLSRIQSAVYVNGNGGYTALEMYDRAATGPGFYGISPWQFGVDHAPELSVNYYGVTNLDLWAGSGANTIMVGAQQVLDLAGTPRLMIDGGGHSNLVVNDSGSLAGSLTTYTVTKTGLTRNTLFQPTVFIDYAALKSLTLYTTNSDNIENIEGTPAPTTVYGGTRANAFTVSSTDRNLDGIGSLTINGGGNATLTVNDQNNPQTVPTIYSVTSTSLTRRNSPSAPAASITYNHLKGLTLNIGNRTNFENVQSTAAGTSVTIDAGAGANTFTVGVNGSVKNVRSAVTLNGSGTNSSVLIDDSQALTQDKVTVTPSQVGAGALDQFFGAGGSLNYTGVGTSTKPASLTLDLSHAFDDTVALTPSTVTHFFVNGNGAAFQAGHAASLNVNTAGTVNPANVLTPPSSGTWTFGNRQSVTYSGIGSPVRDATKQLHIIGGAITLVPGTTSFYQQIVTLTNISSGPIFGPISLVLDSLGGGVSLINATGTTSQHAPTGNPYLDIVPLKDVLNVGQSVTVLLTFTSSSSAAIAYQARVLVGTGPR